MNLRTVIILSKQRLDKKYLIYVQFTKDRKTLRINTDITVQEENFQNGKVMGGPGRDLNASAKNANLSLRLAKYEKILLENEHMIDYLSINAIKELLVTEKKQSAPDYFEFSQSRIDQLEKAGILGAIKLHIYTRNRIKEFVNREKLEFTEIDKNFLEQLQQFYKSQGKKTNTIAAIMRYLRIIYNIAAVEFNKDPLRPIIPPSPFGKHKFTIDTEETQHRSLVIADIKKIIEYHPEGRRQKIAKDLWMFQLMTFGLNTKDLFFLKPSQIKNGRLQGNRFKTGRFYNIKLEPEHLSIIKKYKGKKYLMYFADQSQTERKGNRKAHSRKSLEQWKDQGAFGKMINEGMQGIQDKLKISTDRKITTYYNRHSFVSLMCSKDLAIADDTVSICLSHKKPEKSVKLLDVYRDIDWIRADEANRKLIDYVFAVSFDQDFQI